MFRAACEAKYNNFAKNMKKHEEIKKYIHKI